MRWERGVMLLETRQEIVIEDGPVRLAGEWVQPAGPKAVVIFAHGSGSSRLSPRNRQVAEGLRSVGCSTLLFDLLDPEEDAIEGRRFDIALLSRRLRLATGWIDGCPEARDLPRGYFGASTGAAAALCAAAHPSTRISAVVSRGGRPDLAAECLGRVRCPTRLIVGGEDPEVLTLNRRAAMALAGPRDVMVVPGATHLFEEPGALDEVIELAAQWFERHLIRQFPGAGREAPVAPGRDRRNSS